MSGSCSQGPNACGGVPGGGTLPHPVPLPQLGLHSSLKGLMGKGQNEPLLFKSGSKENSSRWEEYARAVPLLSIRPRRSSV
ncbi:unnamed protein product [Gadus morhua 'NCC']